jgi:hypothetical protein
MALIDARSGEPGKFSESPGMRALTKTLSRVCSNATLRVASTHAEQHHGKAV